MERQEFAGEFLGAVVPALRGGNAGVIRSARPLCGIGIDSASNIATFASKVKIAYPVYVSGLSGTDLSRHFGNATGGLPFTVLIGADGEVKKTYLGRLKFDQLRADLDKL